jgi:hypothetical protein
MDFRSSKEETFGRVKEKSWIPVAHACNPGYLEG